MFRLERIVYDGACHLKKYCINPIRKLLTPVAEKLSEMDMVVDEMYYRNHVDSWCKGNCKPYDRSDLDGVSSNLLWDIFLLPNNTLLVLS